MVSLARHTKLIAGYAQAYRLDPFWLGTIPSSCCAKLTCISLLTSLDLDHWILTASFMGNRKAKIESRQPMDILFDG
jgi:hypothetical protein